MSLLSYAIGRIESLLASIKQLGGAEFPYKDSQDALHTIQELFKRQLNDLKAQDKDTSPAVVKQKCSFSLKDLFRCLPLLGFVLRSTNVRNAFEIFGPLRDIARMVLEPEVEAPNRTTKLLLSSEWGYSPVTYHEISDLAGFVLIGLPAPESSNPLLIPLSGHELGHSVWARHRLKQYFRPDIQKKILDYIQTNWNEYQALFPSVSSSAELDTNLFARQTWLLALHWALKQAEESFCDFIGISIYGTSYLRAFAYLLSPNVSSPRSANYPDSMARVRNLVKAANSYKFDTPQDYEGMFRDRPPQPLRPEDKFRLSAADEALEEIVNGLIKKAKELVSSSDISKPDDSEIKRIYERYKLVVPAEKCKSLADILNAAWEAYEDRGLWSSMPDVAKDKNRVLRDLVLKNIEIFHSEHILRNAQ